MLRKVRISALDALFVGTPLWVAVGPVDVGEREAIVSAVQHLSNNDPQNRIGLLPSAESRRWKFDPNYSARSVVEYPGSESLLSSREAVLNSVLGTTPDVPLAFVVHGDTLLCYFDHGIGDAGLLIDAISAASRSSPGVDAFVPDLPPNTRFPLALAVAATVRDAPRQFFVDGAAAAADILVRLARKVIGLVGPRDPHQVSLVVPSEPYRVVYVESQADYLAQLRKRVRDSHRPGSTAALTVFAICEALESEDIAVDSKVEVLVDLRRYLPRGHATYANLGGVVQVRYWRGISAGEFSSYFLRNTRSARPLVNLCGHLLIAVLRNAVPGKGDRRQWASRPAPSDSLATLTVSDITKVDLARLIKWADNERSQAVVATPPASASHITVLLSSPVEGQVHATAAFFPSVFDPEKVRRALTAALTDPTPPGCTAVTP